jgi:hypothetical protein
MKDTFHPTAAQCAALVVIAGAALGCALYLRYGLIQNAIIGVGCDTGPRTMLCAVRSGAIQAYDHSAFGLVALAVAIINLIRPSVALLAIGLAVSGFGVVLYSYNVLMAGIAVGLMILAFARPARRTA